MKTIRVALILLFAISPVGLISQSSVGTETDNNPSLRASVREYSRTFLTYPFGDPNPVARTGKIYPYYRFDGFSTQGVKKDWKMVEMENEWIKVWVAPEMGGKVWGGIEKSTGKEFIYFNKVVKFRDIAMRGAWTSGGIEFNFGSIGHAPTTATPVDYLTTQNPDGSVSCWIGAMDLTSRTEWRVEIRLPADKAYLETHVFWYNPTDRSTSKYHWATSSADAAPDLTYIFPGDHYIGHDGDAHPWPVLKDGRNISRYSENNYGSDHSYHVLGTYSDFFAGYYATRDFGFGHWNEYPEKLGKKIWIWALSPQGAMWTNLLTDQPGNMQYTELQTGILFNQEAAGSTYTPFKHMEFPAHTCENFSEIWFPIVGTGGASEITKAGVLWVGGQKIEEIRFSPLEFVTERLTIEFSDGTREQIDLDLAPLQLFVWKADSMENPGPEKAITAVRIGSRLKWASPVPSEKDLDRPVVAPTFDWNSAQGLCMKAAEFSRQREYSQARDHYRKCLAKDPRFLPALTGLAEEYIRILKDNLAEELLQIALGVDTYDPKSNFLYGIVKKNQDNEKYSDYLQLSQHQESNPESGNVVRFVTDVNQVSTGSPGFYKALEAFGIAARSMEYRSAAYTEMAGIYLIRKEYPAALRYASMALDYNQFNISALRHKVVAGRLSWQHNLAKEGIERLLRLDPLNHFARYEKFLYVGSEENLLNFTSLIRNEFQEQSYLELALHYHSVGCLKESYDLLRRAPVCAEVIYWRKRLAPRVDPNPVFLPRGNVVRIGEEVPPIPASTYLTFPWRPETLKVIQAAEARSRDWKNRYYMGLIHWNLDDSTRAKELFRSCKDEPQEAHFYLTRARLFAGSDDSYVQTDLNRALALEPGEWRVWQALTAYHAKNRNWAVALDNARKATVKIPGHMILTFDRARMELYNHNYDNCLNILEELILLPAEGAREGHEIYRSALVLRALENFVQKKYARALKDLEEARKWPESLGVGKPYVTDERIENYLAGVIYLQTDRPEEGAKYLNEVINWTTQNKPAWDTPYVVAALSQVLLNREPEGDRYLNDWMKVQPASALMLWSVAAYSNNPAASEKALARLGWKPEETPWGLGDAQFPLVYEVVRKVVVR